MKESGGWAGVRNWGSLGRRVSMFAVLVLLPAPASWAAQTPVRERVSFNEDWRFVKGDPNGAAGGLSYNDIRDWVLASGDPFTKDPNPAGRKRPGGHPGGDVAYVQPGFDDRSRRASHAPPTRQWHRPIVPEAIMNLIRTQQSNSAVFTSPVRGLALLCMLGTRLLHAANPIMPGADPHAMVLGDTVWIYPTWSPGRADCFFAFSSADLVNWQRHGPVLDFKEVSWIKDDGQERHHAWAPCVLAKDGKHYFYYSVGPQNPTPSRIGVAVGDAPAGPFRDSGKPLLTGGDGFEAIDPMVFVDPQSGRTYLYAGGSAGAKLRVFELSPDLVSLAGEIPVSTPPKFTEGVFMHYRDGCYYLSYSHGGWQYSSYSVHYATAETPAGPWTYRGPILTSDATRKGPGHHSFMRSPLTGQWRIVYHRWENQTGDGPYHGSRRICIDDVEYDPDGLIRPVVMTGPAGGRRE